MELKEILAKYIEDNEKLESVTGELSQDFAKTFIPKGRFNEVNEELKTTKEQLSEMKKSMETLTEKASSVEEYEKKLAELQKTNIEIEEKASKQISSITKRTQLKELLLMNNAHKDAIDLLVDKYTDQVEIENEKVKDAEKLLETIRSEKAGLFIEKSDDSIDKGSNKNKKPDDDTEKLRKYLGLK